MTHIIQLRRIRQRGMTLIEFMVGLTIGLLVVLAAVASIIMTRSSARTLSDSVGLEQQATLVMMQIGQQISQAGAVTANPTATGAFPYVTFNTKALGGVNAVSPLVSVFGGTNPDTLSVSYPAPNDDGGLARNCMGNLPTGPAGAQQIISRFSLSGASLVCGTGIPGSASQPIVGSVADMQVLYVLNDPATGVTYSPASASLNWAQVVGVQVCLELEGDQTEAPAQNPFNDCRGQRDIADGRIHRIVKQTFYLRNTR